MSLLNTHPRYDAFVSWAKHFQFTLRNETENAPFFHKWVSNDDYIENVNSLHLSYELGHNQFSAMDSVDFSAYLNRFDRFASPVGEVLSDFSSIESLPTYVNWVEKGAVTPVKDQGQCGSCWSFSSTGALEGAYYLQQLHDTGAYSASTLVSFSEQQLVDCDTFKNGGRDHGCNGGLMNSAFDWIKKNGGLCTESAYPYTSGKTTTSGTCQTTCTNVEGSKVSGYVNVVPESDNEMMAALSYQPVSIAIEADQKDFQLYKSGVFTGTCGTNLDHGVLAVGYGTESGNDYYLVKNSWGVSWGESGYIKLGKGSKYNNGKGQCGMLIEPSYPVL